MRAKLIFYPLAIILIIIVSGSIYGRESYEDYMDQKNKNSYNKDIDIKRDKPLSEINPEDREELLDELRGAVREELDQTISNEKNDRDKK